jgi:hypothetical protein
MEHRLEKNNHQIWLKINTHIYKKTTQKTSIFSLLLWCFVCEREGLETPKSILT